MKKMLFLSLFIISLTIIGCNKDEKSTDENQTTKTDLLTNGSSKSWVTTAFFANGVDITPLQEDCDKDNLVVFSSNGTVHGDAGNTKCDPDDPQTYDEGNWVWANNETQIITTTPDLDLDTTFVDTATVIELSNTILKITGKDDGQVFEVHLQAQ